MCHHVIANIFGGSSFFFINETATTEIYTLSLHDALPIFNNTGTVDVQSGALSLAAGGTSSGAFTIGGAATLEFGAGEHTSALQSHSDVVCRLRLAKKTTNILGAYLATGPLVRTCGDATFN